jgi:hypothetical protein
MLGHIDSPQCGGEVHGGKIPRISTPGGITWKGPHNVRNMFQAPLVTLFTRVARDAVG